MSEPSVKKIDGAWYWFDETWDRYPTAYATREEAIAVQNRYIDEVLDGSSHRQTLKPGDYAWWEPHGRPGKTPCKIIRLREPEEESWGAPHWVIRTLTGPQGLRIADADDLKPMIEMEVLAVARAWSDVKL